MSAFDSKYNEPAATVIHPELASGSLHEQAIRFAKDAMDRSHLVRDVIDRLSQPGSPAAYAKQTIRDALIEHRQYIHGRGYDHPFVRGWRWAEKGLVGVKGSSTEEDQV